MKNWKKILSFALSAMFALSCASCAVSDATLNKADANKANTQTTTPTTDTTETPEETVEDEFTPIFRMAVMSDVHVTPKYNPTLGANFEKGIKAAYTYAEAQEYKTLDALVVTGDLTHSPENDTGSYQSYRDIVFRNVKRETTYMDMLGNHDLYSNETTNGRDDYMDHVNSNLDQYHVVKGFHLISLSTKNGNGQVIRSQANWMSEKMAISNAEDPNKPIFTFQHQKIADTVYGSSGWNASESSGLLMDTFNQYPQVINFSGHSHSQTITTRSIWQGGFTALESGPFASVGFDIADRYAGIPAEAAFEVPVAKDAAAGYFRIVEVDAQNRVRIYTINRETAELSKTPSTLDDPNEVCVFKIDEPGNPDSFIYTDARKDTAAAPYFVEGAAIEVLETTATSVQVQCPQMLDESPLYYRLDLTDADGNVSSRYMIDQFYHGVNADTETYTLSGLTAATEYTVTITPVNIWGIEGTALTKTVTTANA